MEEIYVIPEKPQYSEEIRRLQDSDPASASMVFNPLIQKIVENIAAVKQGADTAWDEASGDTAELQKRVEKLESRPAVVFYAGTVAPADTSILWIDTTANTGGLKYYNGSTWVHVPVAYT